MSFFKSRKAQEVNEEAPSQSGFDDKDLEVLPTHGGQDGLKGKALSFHHTRSFQLSRDMLVQDGDTPVFYAEVSEFKPRKPDITLHRGDQDGPVVAASFFGFGKFRLGVGSDEISQVWTECKRGGVLMSKRYTFEWNGKVYVMQRANSEDTKATGLGKLMLTHFKIVEAETEEVVALYISDKFGKKKGTLTLKSGLAEDLEILFVLGIASWRDKIRREQPKGQNGGGGG